MKYKPKKKKFIIILTIFCLFIATTPIIVRQYGRVIVNSKLDEEDYHSHICDKCHDISISNQSNFVDIKVCHNVINGEHSNGKNCEYCHTNSTQFTPHIGRGICINCHE